MTIDKKIKHILEVYMDPDILDLITAYRELDRNHKIDTKTIELLESTNRKYKEALETIRDCRNNVISPKALEYLEYCEQKAMDVLSDGGKKGETKCH